MGRGVREEDEQSIVQFDELRNSIFDAPLEVVEDDLSDLIILVEHTVLLVIPRNGPCCRR